MSSTADPGGGGVPPVPLGAREGGEAGGAAAVAVADSWLTQSSSHFGFVSYKYRLFGLAAPSPASRCCSIASATTDLGNLVTTRVFTRRGSLSAPRPATRPVTI